MVKIIGKKNINISGVGIRKDQYQELQDYLWIKVSWAKNMGYFQVLDESKPEAEEEVVETDYDKLGYHELVKAVEEDFGMKVHGKKKAEILELIKDK